MSFFAVIGLDRPDSLDKRNAALPEHRAYLKSNDERMLLVGPLRDKSGNSCGSLYVFDADSADEIQEWLNREPFFKASVYHTLLIRRFDPVMTRLPSRDWLDDTNSRK
jgi:uncharacterized protein YciI